MDIVFGDFRMKARERQVSGPGGDVALSARAFDILALLLSKPNEVVSKDAIFAAVWPGVVVEENTLQVHMSALRKALGPSAITTVHGRGYKYVGPSPMAWEGPAPAAPRRHKQQGNIHRFRGECIAREAELAAIVAMLKANRLTSIVGAGGVGKTTAAMEAASRSADAFPGGVWVIDLAPVSGEEQLASAFIQSMAFQYQKGANLPQLMAEHHGDDATLLVLDNCEHIVEAVARLVTELLAEAPRISILLTTQAPLAIPQERIYRMQPFDLATMAPSSFFAHCYESQGETLSDAEKERAARLCARLDGVALAIKMAAARAATLGIDAVDRQLERQMQGLSAKWNAQLPRHQSLLASLEWSFNLLASAEQAGFLALGVFSGSFSAEAAAAVMKDETEEILPELLRRSLVVRAGEGRSRYRLLETSRLFAIDRLEKSGGLTAARRRHAAHMATLLAASLEDWEETPDSDWLRRYGADIDNVRAAFDWAAADGGGQNYMQLTASAYRLWQIIELPEEGFRRGQRALDLAEAGQDPLLAAHIRLALAELARACAYDVQVMELLKPAIPQLRAGSDRQTFVAALILLADQLMFTRGIDEARPYFAELSEAGAQLSPSKLRGWADASLGMFRWLETRDTSHLALCGAGFAMHRRFGSVRGEGRARLFVQELLHQNGETAMAIAMGLEFLEVARPIAHRRELWIQCHNLACYYLHDGKLAEARTFHDEATAYSDRADDSWHWCMLQNSADFVAQSGDHERAAKLMAFIDRRLDATPDGRQETEIMQARRIRELLKKAAPEEKVRQWMQEGPLMTIEDADLLAGLPPKRK